MRGYFYIIMAALLMLFPTFSERYKGHTAKMLVAYKMAPGNYFENAVVYVVAHGVMGATGFVLGNQIEADGLSVFENIPEKLRDAGGAIFNGGPVGRDTTFFVLERKGGSAPHWGVHDFSAIDDLHEEELIADIVESYKMDDVPRYLMFVGYAGWAATQLELEVWRGSWLVLDAFDASFSSMPLSAADAVWLDAFKRAAKKSEKKLGKIY